MTAEWLGTGIAVIKTATLVLGLSITYFAFRAYQETRAKPIVALAAGFGLITLGVLTAGLAHEILRGLQDELLFVEAVITVLGFGIIFWSLYAEW